jgi:purine-nucleoside phosphorylase
MKESPTYADLARAARAAPPAVAVVLGSGMGAVARNLHADCRVPFEAVPGLTASSVVGHAGTITLGDWGSKRVLLFQGRVHFYEGHPWRTVVRSIHTAAALGAKVLLLTNASGGIHDALGPGSLMAIRDQIDWTQPYCWRQPGPGGVGPSRPSPYSGRLVDLLVRTASDIGFALPTGIYASVAGPCYETPAEICALKACGADAVGMSTAREIQAGCDLGMECAAVSCITNRAAEISSVPLRHDEVLATAAAQADRLAGLLNRFLKTL